MSIENTILTNLIYNEQYVRKVLPYLKEEYFGDKSTRTIFKVVREFIGKYNNLPTMEAVKLEIANLTNIDEKTFKECNIILEELEYDEKTDQDWLVDTTEKFCKDNALANAITDAYNIFAGENKNFTPDAIPQLLQDALAVSFDQSVGHSYFDDWEKRFDSYHTKERKISFGIESLDKITRGGVSEKTLNVFLGVTGKGKSMVMCSLAANNLRDGKNVLYITLEMSEDKISERIDANLLDIPIDLLDKLTKEEFQKKLERVKQRTTGKLIVKEYPSTTAHVNHFRHLLQELKLKQNFVPDIIYLDYLAICASSRIKANLNVGSYSYIKAVAEETRGLAAECGIPIISAVQTNREGMTSSELEMDNVADSIGITYTVDLFLAIISDENLDKLGQIHFKQLKNRYNDPNFMRKFPVGVDKSKMKLYDLTEDEKAKAEDIIEGYEDEEDVNDKHKENLKKFREYQKRNGKGFGKFT